MIKINIERTFNRFANVEILSPHRASSLCLRVGKPPHVPNRTRALRKKILNEYDERLRIWTYVSTSTFDGVTHISGLTLQSAAFMHYGEF